MSWIIMIHEVSLNKSEWRTNNSTCSTLYRRSTEGRLKSVMLKLNAQSKAYCVPNYSVVPTHYHDRNTTSSLENSRNSRKQLPANPRDPTVLDRSWAASSTFLLLPSDRRRHRPFQGRWYWKRKAVGRSPQPKTLGATYSSSALRYLPTLYPILIPPLLLFPSASIPSFNPPPPTSSSPSIIHSFQVKLEGKRKKENHSAEQISFVSPPPKSLP
ncbi:hypothetical protein BDV59DRAFT_146076 [Aspergillus ambiguus]|uniref:uncharacterized protein n=1 Tax=Aspergillus ambiguus TaxID=176160 RepID=UPI003CCDC865